MDVMDGGFDSRRVLGDDAYVDQWWFVDEIQRPAAPAKPGSLMTINITDCLSAQSQTLTHIRVLLINNC